MKRILISAGTLVFVGALAVSATGAFFSDTETSTGNTFAAGDIDLQIDNTSYVNDCNLLTPCTDTFILSTTTSWTLTDLEAGVQKFFNFSDLKPGDLGEDTISIHVGSNDAWMCAAAQITADNDVTYTEPEEDDDLTDGGDPTLTDGELDSSLQFAFWVDDGDNVLEESEYDGGAGIFLQGTLENMGDAGQITLADASSTIMTNGGPIPGDTTFYIGKAWCFGTLAPDPVADGAGQDPTVATGLTCDGSNVNNAAQTDMVQGDMQFYAVQSRNNPNFTCALDYDPIWPQS